MPTNHDTRSLASGFPIHKSLPCVITPVKNHLQQLNSDYVSDVTSPNHSISHPNDRLEENAGASYMKSLRFTPFICSFCEEGFESELDLEWHEQTQHVTAALSVCTGTLPEKESISKDMSSEIFDCKICRIVFKDESSRNEHVIAHENASIVVNENRRSELESANIFCKDCDYSSSSKENIEAHMKNYHDIANLITKSQTEANNMISEMKSEFRAIFKTISEELNTIKNENLALKQEVFILRQKHETETSVQYIEKATSPKVPMPGAVQSPNIVPEMEIISGPNLSEKEDLVSTETKKVAKSSEYRNVLIVGEGCLQKKKE